LYTRTGSIFRTVAGRHSHTLALPITVVRPWITTSRIQASRFRPVITETYSLRPCGSR
jgi:hypothetical protein